MLTSQVVEQLYTAMARALGDGVERMTPMPENGATERKPRYWQVQRVTFGDVTRYFVFRRTLWEFGHESYETETEAQSRAAALNAAAEGSSDGE